MVIHMKHYFWLLAACLVVSTPPVLAGGPHIKRDDVLLPPAPTAEQLVKARELLSRPRPAEKSAADGSEFLNVGFFYDPDFMGQGLVIDDVAAYAIDSAAAANETFQNSAPGIAAVQIAWLKPWTHTDLDGKTLLEVLQDLSTHRLSILADEMTGKGVSAIHVFSRYVNDGYCGQAYFGTPFNHAAPENSFAFGALRATYNCGGSESPTFAHELGHNLGMAHDIANAGTGQEVAYAHGYSCGGSGTVMSYTWPKLLQFSDPDVLNNGEPCGDAATADNTRVFEENAALVAGSQGGDRTLPAINLTIVDHASPVVVSESAGTVTVRVARRSSAGSAFAAFRVVDLETSGGEVVAPNFTGKTQANASEATVQREYDFVLVKFADGESLKEFSVELVDDEADEGDERFEIVSVGAIGLNAVDVEPLQVTVSDSYVDTTPNAFSFASSNDVALGVQVVSQPITLSAFVGSLSISVDGGEYSIGCTDSYTASAGTVVDGDQVCVRHVSASTHSTTTSTTLTVGSLSAVFSSTTVASSTGGGGTGGGTGGDATDSGGGGGGSFGYAALVLAALAARRVSAVNKK